MSCTHICISMGGASGKLAECHSILSHLVLQLVAIVRIALSSLLVSVLRLDFLFNAIIV